MTSPVRVALIGVGGMARHHIRQLLKMQSTTRIVALCEPSDAMALEASRVFVEAGISPPPNQPDWQKLIAEYGAERFEGETVWTHASDRGVQSLEAKRAVRHHPERDVPPVERRRPEMVRVEHHTVVGVSEEEPGVVTGRRLDVDGHAIGVREEVVRREARGRPCAASPC